MCVVCGDAVTPPMLLRPRPAFTNASIAVCTSSEERPVPSHNAFTVMPVQCGSADDDTDANDDDDGDDDDGGADTDGDDDAAV